MTRWNRSQKCAVIQYGYLCHSMSLTCRQYWSFSSAKIQSEVIQTDGLSWKGRKRENSAFEILLNIT